MSEHIQEKSTLALVPASVQPNQPNQQTPEILPNILTMSSQEIADLTSKRHDNVMRDIRTMLVELHGEGGVLSFEDTHTNPQNGQQYSIFRLPKRETLILISGYSITMRAAIIDRWQELEAQNAKPAFPQSLPEALRLAADLAEQKMLAEQERDLAIATKSLIGHRREATAMNTASQAVKQVSKLQIELDQSKKYATVKRMEMLYHGQKFNWRLLKSTANQMELPPICVFDVNYGSVNSYHADVWQEAYALGILEAQPA